MSHRVHELVERQALLQRRCATQRVAIAGEIASIEARFAGVDRMASVAGKVLLHPVVLTGGAVALLTMGRARSMRLVGRLFVLTTAARRLLKAVQVFQGLTRARSEGVSA